MSEEAYQDYIKMQMYKYKDQALTKMIKIIHPAYVDQFAAILHYCWQENLPEAEKLAESLYLYPVDFAAISEEPEEFSEEYRKELVDVLMEKYA